MNSPEFKKIMSDIPSLTVTSRSSSARQVKTEQINLRLPVEWITVLSAAAVDMSEELGEDVNMQTVIKLCLLEKFGNPK